MNYSKEDVYDRLPANIHPLDIHPTGSRYICTPSPTDTDEDWIILVTVPEGKNLAWYCAQEQKETGDQSGDGSFVSIRGDDLNIIVTEDGNFFRRFIAATKVARDFNLLKKEDRVKLFQAVLYGNY